ncbi:MAG: hypothetical protein K2X93_03785 [Candidatus Obscuribacterales bacterium]|nr:hypothetical protein [Candidatus Obscuribacterales bacterium]
MVIYDANVTNPEKFLPPIRNREKVEFVDLEDKPIPSMPAKILGGEGHY